MRRGDRIVNYVSGDHAFRAVWEITRGHHILDGAFPECVEVRPIVINEDGVKFDEVKDKLNCFRKLADKKRWSGLVRQSARGWDYHDGQIILNALLRGDIEADLGEIEQRPIKPTLRRRLVNARLGQGQFRSDVLARWENRCAVSGSSVPEAIRASHMKPWRQASDRERLDPENGLPLLATLDALFDRGLITFDDDGWMKLSPVLDKQEELDRLGIGNKPRLGRKLTAGERRFLGHHRDIFLSSA